MAEPTGVEAPIDGADEPVVEGAPPAGYEHSEESFSEYTSETPQLEDVAAPVPAPTGPATGTGRRKQAVARVRIVPGTGQWRVNGQSLDGYFPNKVHQQIVNEPFVTLGAEDGYDVIARVSGGGVTGQAGALRLGIARALSVAGPDNRPGLKKAGFLTRDPRAKERKKYGLKKSRKAPQYSKR